MKYCNTCATTKDISDFNKNKTTKEGVNSKCRSCDKQYKKDNAKKFAAYSKEWKLANPEKLAAIRKKYKQANPEKSVACSKLWRQKNSKQDAATKKKYQQENPDKVNASNAKRRAAKENRVPEWLNEARKTQITALYTQARKLTTLTGIQFHVDHIVPLQGQNVSGLHIPDNLQILTEHENCSKSNKF